MKRKGEEKKREIKWKRKEEKQNEMKRKRRRNWKKEINRKRRRRRIYTRYDTLVRDKDGALPPDRVRESNKFPKQRSASGVLTVLIRVDHGGPEPRIGCPVGPFGVLAWARGPVGPGPVPRPQPGLGLGSQDPESVARWARSVCWRGPVGPWALAACLVPSLA